MVVRVDNTKLRNHCVDYLGRVGEDKQSTALPNFVNI